MMETIIVKDEHGVTRDVRIEICARFAISIDCGCWGHREPWPGEVIVTKHGLTPYVRFGTDGFFRVADGIGPVRLSISKVTKQEG